MKPNPPIGTVTFLFTDIEGSIKLAQEHTDASPALLARHQEILKRAIEAYTYNGFVFQVVGDSFSVAFDTATNALKAASETQRLLHHEVWLPTPIKVRMGITYCLASSPFSFLLSVDDGVCVIFQMGHHDLFGVHKMETINITEAKSRFSEYLSRAASGERFIIMRRARPLVALISAGDLERLERFAEITSRLAQTLGQSLKLLAKIEASKVHPAMAAFGLWQDEEDLNDLETQIMNNRLGGSSRPRTTL